MATDHNRRFAATQRRQQVTALYIQGWTQAEIAQHLETAQSTICKDVEYVRKQWERSAIRNFDQLRAREIQKLEYLEREAWAAWERSKKPAQSAVVMDQGNAGQKTRKSLKHQVGDPRYLDQVSRSIAQRRPLLGLDALPVPPVPGADDGLASLEVRRERVVALIAAISERERIGPVGTGPGNGQSGDVRGGDERGAVENGAPRRLPGPDAAGGN